MTTLSMYFIMGSSNIIIDGQNNTVNINLVTNYPGLIQNGYNTNNVNGIITNGYSNIKIKNLGVTSASSTLSDGGWIGQSYMNYNTTGCEVTNCYSTGAISGFYSGGIFGVSSKGTATNCYSANGNWNDQIAITNLTGAPTYSGSALTQQGTVWIDIVKISFL